MPDSCLITWSKLGPFDIESLVETNVIKINDKLKFSQAQQRQKKDVKYDYFGQVTAAGKIEGVGRGCFYGDSLYEGQLKNGIKSGYGRLILKNGDYFEGQFKNGQKNGDGLYVTMDGKVLKGFWWNNEFKQQSFFEPD